MPARGRPGLRVPEAIIGYTLVIHESFKPAQSWAPRLEPGAYEVVSFWNFGPIIGLGPNAVSLEWGEVTEYGLLYSPEEWAKRETHMPRPRDMKSVTLNKPRCSDCDDPIDFSLNGRLQGRCYACSQSKPKTVWERLGEEP